MPTSREARHGRPTPRRRTRPDHRTAAALARARRAAGLGTARLAAFLILAAAPATAAAAGTTTAAARAADPERTPIAPAADAGPASTAGDLGGTLIRLGIGLVVVVGLILGVWHLMKRSQRARMPGAGGPAGSLVDVVSTTPIGPNRFLHLVRVGGDLILIGATEHSVTPVARISGDEAVELLGADVPAAAAEAAFAAPPGAATDPRVRAVQTSHDTGIVDRLRSLTARR